MKSLTITRVKDSFFMLPPEMQMQLMEGAAAFIDKYRKAGKCKEIYVVPGWKMSVSIWEVESAEETDRLFTELPMFAFMGVENYTLSDFDAHVKAEKEMFDRLAKK